MDSETISLLSVPLFTGAIGYVTNWSGVLMLFYPVSFRGIKVPGLATIARFFPRKVRQVPLGFTQGGIGWQGIVPSRAAKMGSIAVDKGIAKLGSPREFYERLEPDAIAEHIVATSRDDIRDLVDRTLQREHPVLWNDLPPRVREAVHARVQEQLPEVVRSVTDGIGADIDHLMDVKLMVIRQMEERPELANRIFLEIGKKELRFIINFGFWFGLAARDPDRDPDRARLPRLVAAADLRGVHRLRHQPARDPDDLRADRGAADRSDQAARPLPAAPARGRRDLLPGDRRGRRQPLEHRPRAARGPAVRPHAEADRQLVAAGDRPGERLRPPRRPRRGRDRALRHDPRVGRHRGRRLHDDPARGPRRSTSARARRSPS